MRVIALLLLAGLAAAGGGWRVSGSVDPAHARVSTTGAMEPVAGENFDLPLAVTKWEEGTRGYLYIHPEPGWVTRRYANAHSYNRMSRAGPRPYEYREPIALEPGASTYVTGLVRDASGRAEANALVVVRFGHDHTVTWTDEDGRFRTHGALPSGDLRFQVYPSWQTDSPPFEFHGVHDVEVLKEHEFTVASGPRVSVELVEVPAEVQRYLGLRWHARLRQIHEDGRRRDWSWRMPASEAPKVLRYAHPEFEGEEGWSTWLELEAPHGAWGMTRELKSDWEDVQLPMVRHAQVQIEAQVPTGWIRSGEFTTTFEPIEVRTVSPFGQRPVRGGRSGMGTVKRYVPDHGRYRVTAALPGHTPEVFEVEVTGEDLEVKHLLLLPEHSSSIVGTVRVPHGQGPVVAGVTLIGDGVELREPALPPLIVRTVNGHPMELADGRSYEARFRFVDVEPGTYNVVAENLATGEVIERQVRTGQRNELTLNFTRQTVRALGVDVPGQDRVPFAFQPPGWPIPRFYDLPTGVPSFSWSAERRLGWCMRVPGYQPQWGTLDTWQGEEILQLPLIAGWGFEFAFRAGVAEGYTRDSARERWATLEGFEKVCDIEVRHGGQEIGFVGATGSITVVGSGEPEGLSFLHRERVIAGHQGWKGGGHDILWHAPQVIFRMREKF